MTVQDLAIRSAQLDADTLRHVAIHEAAHEVVAKHLGYVAEARVWPCPANNSREGRAWQGQTGLYTQTSREDRAVIGLVGILAEYMLSGPIDERDVQDNVLSEWHALSATDRSHIGDHPIDDDDAARAVDLLRRLWPQIDARAADLIAFAQYLWEVVEEDTR